MVAARTVTGQGPSPEAAAVLAADGIDSSNLRREAAGESARFVVRVPPGRAGLGDRLVSEVVAGLKLLGDDVLAVYAPR